MKEKYSKTVIIFHKAMKVVLGRKYFYEVRATACGMGALFITTIVHTFYAVKISTSYIS